MRMCKLLCPLFIALATLVTSGTTKALDLDADLEDAIQRHCHRKVNAVRCIKACRAAEKNNFNAVSMAGQSTCEYELRATESKRLGANRACSASACLYRLREVRAAKDREVYSGAGYRLTITDSINGRAFELSEKSGATTRFHNCSQCTMSELEYKSGPLKGATMSWGAGNSVMLSVPR